MCRKRKTLIPQGDVERESQSPLAKRLREEPPAAPTAVASEAAGDEKKKEQLDSILTRTGGAYIPPARLRMMQESITDKTRWVCYLGNRVLRERERGEEQKGRVRGRRKERV